MIKRLFLAIIILILSANCMSQPSFKPGTYPELSIGNLKGTRLNIDSFKAQKELKVNGVITIKSANIYFTGANFPQAILTTLNGSSLEPLRRIIDKCVPGSVVTIENLKVEVEKGINRTMSCKSFYFYSSNGNIDTAYLVREVSETKKQFFELMEKEFLSGTIYFSGENFTNVITITKKDFFLLPNYFGRCAPGSIITFENCIYKNPDGSLSKPLTKTIKLD